MIVSSLASHQVLPGIAAYCASKSGVLMLGKALAREWANRGINVNSICPGFIETELNDEFLASEAGQRMIAGISAPPRDEGKRPRRHGAASAVRTRRAESPAQRSISTTDRGSRTKRRGDASEPKSAHGARNRSRLSPDLDGDCPMAARRLRFEIGLALCAKLAALTLLYFLFFSPASQPQPDPDSVAAHLTSSASGP